MFSDKNLEKSNLEIVHLALVFTVRRYALHGLCDHNSVRLFVCLSVTLVFCVHMVRPTIMISSPYGSPIMSSEYFTYMATRQPLRDATVDDLCDISRPLDCFTSNFSRTVTIDY